MKTRKRGGIIMKKEAIAAILTGTIVTTSLAGCGAGLGSTSADKTATAPTYIEPEYPAEAYPSNSPAGSSSDEAYAPTGSDVGYASDYPEYSAADVYEGDAACAVTESADGWSLNGTYDGAYAEKYFGAEEALCGNGADADRGQAVGRLRAIPHGGAGDSPACGEHDRRDKAHCGTAA